jgi:hypothetical protein
MSMSFNLMDGFGGFMNFCGCFKLVNKDWRVELYSSMDVNP